MLAVNSHESTPDIIQALYCSWSDFSTFTAPKSRRRHLDSYIYNRAQQPQHNHQHRPRQWQQLTSGRMIPTTHESAEAEATTSGSVQHEPDINE